MADQLNEQQQTDEDEEEPGKNCVQGKIEEVLDALKLALTDFSGEVHAEVPNFLLKCHMWAAVCLVGYSLAQWLGRKAFYLFMQAFPGNWIVLTICIVFGPAIFGACSPCLTSASDDPKQTVFRASIMLGLFTGTILRHRRLASFVPPCSVIPLSIASLSNVFGAFPFIRNDRKMFVLAVISPLIYLCIIGGCVQAAPSYFLYLAALMLAAVIDLQLKIKNGNSQTLGSMALEQWKTVATMATADTTAFWILSKV